MVPDICVQHCGSNGFTFAGLLMASECLCGLYFKGESKVRNEECMLPCQGDRERSCGGQKFIAIYSTNQEQSAFLVNHLLKRSKSRRGVSQTMNFSV